MSSPLLPDPEPRAQTHDEDDPMQGSGQEEEDEVEKMMPGPISDDSSEEPEEDEEEERRIRDGFIVDEDEEEEVDDDSDRRRRRKRRKRRHRHDEVGDLEDDDLELLQENTGADFSHRLTRLRRAGGSGSPPPASSSKRKVVVVSSDDDLDNDIDSTTQDIANLWDDERGVGAREEDDEMDLDDMDNFIEYEDEEGAGAMNDAEREQKRRERRRMEKERRKALGNRPELAGIDATAWDEIQDVFGDGSDYAWALGDDDGEYDEENHNKVDMKYQDVFEPAEIRARMLTEDDDLIRAQDTPERMQLVTPSLSLTNTTLVTRLEWREDDLDDAATWVLTRLSKHKEKEFLQSSGRHHQYLRDLVEAIKFSLRCLFIQEFEVPYIYTYKRDYISYFNPEDMRTRLELLSQEDIWRVYALGQKYCSFLERRNALDSFYTRLGTKDDYFDAELRRKLNSVEMVADATEWLGMRYKDTKRSIAQELRFHDDADEPEVKKHQRPSRNSAYNVAKKSIVSQLADGFGISPQQVVLNFATTKTFDVEDQDLNPIAYADQFVDSDTSKAQPPEDLLRSARMIIATELGKDPLLRQAIRDAFKTDALISVSPTDRGIAKIDEHNPYYNFKYLSNKPILEMLESPQFLNILAAESEHLVTVSITLSADVAAKFERKLVDAFESSNYSESAKAWNEERSRAIQETMESHLLPIGVKWTREWLREEIEDWSARRCSLELRNRIDVAPFVAPTTQIGDTPSVLAVSWGKGDPQKDAITLVFIDEAGRFREHVKIDNLVDSETRDEFNDLIQRRRPDVIAIGGFSLTTTKLSQRVKEAVGITTQQVDNRLGHAWGDEPRPPPPGQQDSNIPVIYVHDEVARIYQHSKRAEEEFSALSPTAKYCIGIARYVQSPLNEYSALGADVTAISFDEESQQLLPHDKLLFALERVLVDVTNRVGVDINRAVTDPYYQHLLPLVCGLGPRKAQLLVKKIAAMGGNLINREHFIKGGLLTTKIFLNAAGFLRIINDSEPVKHSKNRHMEDADVADPLDNTRIHPEDYELARKMATDALELDEEDIHDEHPSHVVSTIIHDEDNERKLNELNLDDFAVNMYETNQDRKRYILFDIRTELLKPFGENRKPFKLPGPWDILTMLTGESPKNLRVGLIVSVNVLRIKPTFVAVRLDSGIEGLINSQYLSDVPGATPDTVVQKGQTIPGVVIDVKLHPQADSFWVELSARPSDVGAGDSQFRRVKPDDYWDHNQHEKDMEMQKRKKRAEANQTRRVIKHPNFHNFNSSQAEAYLDKQQRGDVVIRPSSKGQDHLAVTWKVDDKLYQHIDVTEPNADVTGQSVGSRFYVEGGKEYSDLDELIVNHVHAIARRVEELMAHEKFKQGPEDELHMFLKNFVAANPSKSAYGFTLNRRKPGHFNLCFLANKNSPVQTWPVRVAPEAYYLFDAPAPGVPELCDAFKVRHLNESQNKPLGSGMTPYPGRTPGRTPGHATPGHMSVRHTARTPNPYGGSTHHPSATPAYAGPPYGNSHPNQYGYQTPGYPSRTPGYQQIPPSMNPDRAAAMVREGAWVQSDSVGGWGAQ